MSDLVVLLSQDLLQRRDPTNRLEIEDSMILGLYDDSGGVPRPAGACSSTLSRALGPGVTHSWRSAASQ